MNDKQKLNKLKEAFEEIEAYMRGDEIKHFVENTMIMKQANDGDYDFDFNTTIERLENGKDKHIYWHLCILKGLLTDEEPAKILQDSIEEAW